MNICFIGTILVIEKYNIETSMVSWFAIDHSLLG